MLISQRWLKELVDFSATPEELERILTMLGLEVEKIERPGDKLRNFVVGEVLTKEKHPNADKLSVCTVAVGGGTVNTIVCGAPNVAAGQKVPVALSGAVVPNGGFTIEKRKLRGVESNGMICSKAELGISEESDGIWELHADAPLGETLAGYLGLDDVLYEISITPNRSDCLSHLGIAREIAAYFHSPLRKPEARVQEDSGLKVEDRITVKIEDTEGCHRFAGRVVRGVKIGESPKWLKDRITACGLRSINNVVDVTNYVMLECGKPIHAFDLDKIAGKTLVIKQAQNGEKFTTLDGKERTVDSSMVMVCDAEKSSAVGGIMGGLYSEISDGTVNVLIESAYFKPSSIRRTAKKLGISSDAAYRFERGVDMETVVFAADRAAELIQQVAGGQIASGVVDVYPTKQPEKQVTVRYARADMLIGKHIPSTEQRALLTRLGFTVLNVTDESASYRVPTYRVDVETETDCIEEIARLHGYDNIAPALHSRVNLSGEQTPPRYAPLPFVEELSAFFRANGFTDIVTQNMIDPKSAALFTESPVRIANPLGEELSCMRPSLLPSMLKTVERNHRYGQKNLRLVELGAVFHTVPQTQETFIGGVLEERHFCAALTGNILPQKSWDASERPTDFYDAKGVLESLVAVCRLNNAEIKPLTNLAAYPLFSANAVELVIGGTSFGCAGEISAAALKIFDIGMPVVACLVNLSALSQTRTKERKYAAVSPFPTVARDLAFVVETSVDAAHIQECIVKNGGNYLRTVRIFDVFSGKAAKEALGEGKKSIAFALEFNSAEKTLEEAEVEAGITAIVETVRTRFGAALRS
ncbi:MAG: phenylalanine--tRNA ligase subunit beta [Candidatus Kapabacteria bacterium]|jgi:phenylalanyl-tRNA synthetase beta chain|nr:phenylalanine--tRNA ligase subunit beta [Candidatus Kapabacteria bacterium]